MSPIEAIRALVAGSIGLASTRVFHGLLAGKSRRPRAASTPSPAAEALPDTEGPALAEAEPGDVFDDDGECVAVGLAEPVAEPVAEPDAEPDAEPVTETLPLGRGCGTAWFVPQAAANQAVEPSSASPVKRRIPRLLP